MSRSRTITDELWSDDPADWLENAHAGQMLKLEFLEPLAMSEATLAEHIGVEPARVIDVVEGRRPMDGELDLRLARYFRMSAGFFLGLQHDYEMLEARRRLAGQLDRILPRAA